MDSRIVDIAVFVIANAINFLLIGLFLSRPKGLVKVERVCGLASVSMILPLAAASVFNLSGKREWWTIVLPSIMILFLAVELMFDYIWKRNFRQTRWLWPYLVLFYSAEMAMIGYAFLTRKTYGFVTLGTYFLSLLATWYSYIKVGHGQ